MLLSLMVPAVVRGGSGRRRPEDEYQPFSWWLDQNQGRVVQLLTRYQNRRVARGEYVISEQA